MQVRLQVALYGAGFFISHSIFSQDSSTQRKVNDQVLKGEGRGPLIHIAEAL